MQSISTFLPQMISLSVMTDLPPLNGPPAPRGPQRPRPMLAVMTDHPYVPEVVWIPRHALLQYPDREECIIKSKQLS